MYLEKNELFLLEYFGSLKGHPIDIKDFPDHIKGKFPEGFDEEGNLNEILQGLKRQGYTKENGPDYWTITQSGKSILDVYIQERKKDNLQKEREREKAAIDLELANRNLKDYKTTKFIARISFIIASGLAILEFIQWLKAG